MSAELVERLIVAAEEYEKAVDGDDGIMLDIGFAHGHLFAKAAAYILALEAERGAP